MEYPGHTLAHLGDTDALVGIGQAMANREGPPWDELRAIVLRELARRWTPTIRAAVEAVRNEPI